MGIVTMPDSTLSQFNGDINNLIDSDKFIVNEFMGLTTFNAMVNINNHPTYFDCTMVTPNNVLDVISDIDYLTLNENDTIVVDNFIDLLKRLTNV
jgi:hypothetical protein